MRSDMRSDTSISTASREPAILMPAEYMPVANPQSKPRQAQTKVHRDISEQLSYKSKLRVLQVLASAPPFAIEGQ